MLPQRVSELEEFKSRIDLRDFAISEGFEYVRRQSSKNSSVLKHPNGDKIVVARMPWKHYVYFNVHASSPDDSGSIIDFVQTRKRCSLGEVRKTLRAWSGVASVGRSENESPLLPALEPSSQDAARVFANWTKARMVKDAANYLTNQRGIPHSLICDPKFAGRIRVDIRQNILFGHYNASGLCGYEVKNRGFTGFSPGGTKGLMFSSPDQDDHTMVICETGVDLLSVAAIEGIDGRRFFSMAGQPSPAQIGLLQSAAEKMPTPKPTALLALDNDDAGIRMSKVIRSALAPHCSEIRTHFPPGNGQDWNDVLQCLRKSASPQFRIACSP